MLKVLLAVLLGTAAAPGEAATLEGMVRDATGGALPGVSVELRRSDGVTDVTVSDVQGVYRFEGVPPGDAQLTFTLINFGAARREVRIVADRHLRADVTLHLSLTADVIVTGKRTFANLADAERPAEDLVGIAQSASQGAITARQLDARPMLRSGDVLETVPGVIASQYSGAGKANQYYLRGFNLDHGTDFATTVAGMPVNMPTHAHGQGYSDVNFLIPELVSGVQFSKGPYFADQGDFATAGAANINYVTSLDSAIVRVTGGAGRYGRVLGAVSPRVGFGHVLAAVEAGHDDGPWARPDDYQKVNGLVRYTRGDQVNRFSLTGMGYRAAWNATDQVPRRAIENGLLGRFAAMDSTDGGNTYRYSGSAEWQTTRGTSATKVTAYGIGYDLHLFSNFTYFLDDAENGDQFEQADHRFVSGVRISHRRIGRWRERPYQNTFGGQLRNDRITNVGLYHTNARRRIGTLREDSIAQTSSGAYAQNEIDWTPWLRSLVGLRADGYRFDSRTAGIVSPKGGIVIGPFQGTELYVNAGLGFHSNDARAATTPLVRARGREAGIRTVALPHVQSSLSVWSLDLDSELVFVGDAGTTAAGRPSHRYGFEWANYVHPRRWLVVDGDLSVSRSRFVDRDPAGDRIPGSVETVASLGATVDPLRNVFGSVRLRYFGPRPLVEDGSMRSKATSLVNLEAGYKLSRTARIALDVFNLLNARHSDIDYYYASRLPGEPAGGVDDIHFHPTLPRTARVHLQIGF